LWLSASRFSPFPGHGKTWSRSLWSQVLRSLLFFTSLCPSKEIRPWLDSQLGFSLVTPVLLIIIPFQPIPVVVDEFNGMIEVVVRCVIQCWFRIPFRRCYWLVPHSSFSFDLYREIVLCSGSNSSLIIELLNRDLFIVRHCLC
jgi:hypothetical protein